MAKSPPDVAATICEIGCKRAKLPIDKMLVSGILAGAYIGFGVQLSTTVTQDLATRFGVGFSNFMGGAVFSVGLMLVILAGAELFTGNNLIAISCCSRKIAFRDLLKNWAIVYLGNFLGSILLALIVFGGGLYAMGDYALGVRAITIAYNKVNLGFLEAVCRGIACNWLVCLAVWMATSSSDAAGKILSCFFPIMAFVASGFEHSVANMYYIPMGIFLKSIPTITYRAGLNLTDLNWGSFLFKNLLPVTIGNIIGGAFFVATIYWYIYLRNK